MREKIAILLCALTIALSLALSAVFAILHNRPSVANRPPTGEAPLGKSSLPESPPPGQKLFETQNCGTCHSLAGVGNPRLPLDGIGLKLNDQEIRDWITGSGAATNKLSAPVLKRKQRYQSLPEDQMRLLIAHLRTGAL